MLNSKRAASAAFFIAIKKPRNQRMRGLAKPINMLLYRDCL